MYEPDCLDMFYDDEGVKHTCYLSYHPPEEMHECTHLRWEGAEG